jgi:outer membrane protein
VAGVTVSQPLFTGGLNESLIRQAREQNTADRIDIEKQRRGAGQPVSQAWSNILSARANVATDEEAVSAARVAAEGAREEYRVGRRITLDVLQAEKQVRDAELALVQARHDGYLAEAQLLAAVGRLEARNLLDSPKLYDAQAAFKKVRSAGATPLDGLAGAFDSLGRPHTKPIGVTSPSSENASGVVRTGPGLDAPPVR